MAVKKILFSVTAIILVCVTIAGLAEYVASLERTAPLFEYQGLRFRLDRGRLYTIIPYCRDDINGQGYRDRDFTRRRSGKGRTLFLGDSFVMALNLPPDQTIPKALERRLGDGHEVFNLGVVSYGPDQSFLQLLDEGLDLEPDVVLLAVFAGNDFDDVAKNRLFLVDKEERLIRTSSNAVTSVVPGSNLLYQYETRYLLQRRRSMEQRRKYDGLFDELFIDTGSNELILRPGGTAAREQRALMKAILLAFKDVLAAKGITFAVVILPAYENIQNDTDLREKGITRERYFTNERTVARMCEAAGIMYLDLSRHFQEEVRRRPLYDEADHHLNTEGVALAADHIASLLRKSVGVSPEVVE